MKKTIGAMTASLFASLTVLIACTSGNNSSSLPSGTQIQPQNQAATSQPHSATRSASSLTAKSPPSGTIVIYNVVHRTSHLSHARSGLRPADISSSPPPCPTGVNHCVYPGDTIIAHASNPFNGGIPIYLFLLNALPAGVTFSAAPNPQDGVAPNLQTLTIPTSVTTPVGGYLITVDWSFNADGSDANLPESFPYLICDPATGICPSPPPVPTPSDTPTATPTAPPTAAPPPTPVPDFPDVSTDSAASTCGVSGNVACIIQGHQLQSATYYNVSCPSVAYPAFCGAVTSTYAISNVPSGLTYGPSALSAPANTLEAFSLGSPSSISPGLYGPIASTNTIDVDGVPMAGAPASATQSVRVLCSLDAGTCAEPPKAATVYACAPTPAPLLSEGVEVTDAKRRVATRNGHPSSMRRYGTSGGNLALVEPNPDGSCPTAAPVVQVSFAPTAYVGPGLAAPAAQASKRRADAASSSPYYCSATIHEFPQNHDLTDPKSPLYYNYTLSCDGWMRLTAVTTTFRSFTYNGMQPAGNKAVQEQLCPLQEFALFVTCDTTPEPVLNPAGLSSKIQIVVYAKGTGGAVDRETQSGYFYLNDNSVDYPVVDATSDGYPGAVPFPSGAIITCTGGRTVGCSARDGQFRSRLKAFYQKARYALPANLSLYDAHHILPRAWGGSNDETTNGVFLTNHSTATDQHQIFSTWWCGFSLPSSTAKPSCLEEAAD